MTIADTVEGTQIYYEEQGCGEITLVFIHGGGINMDNWKYQQDFSLSYRCIFIDLAGHGKSTTNRRRFTMESLGADIAYVINSLNIENFILIGHSMGGAISLETAIRLKTRPLGIIILDSLFPNPKGLYPKRTEAEITDFMERNFANPDLFLKNLYDNYVFKRNTFNQEDKELMRNLRDGTDLVIFRSEVEELMRWDLHQVLKKVKTPIKAIMAGISVPIGETRDLYNTIFDALFVEDVAHFLHLEEPDEVNKILYARIEELISS